MDLIKKFIAYLENQKNTPSAVTVKNYKADVRQFISWYSTYYKKAFNPAKVTTDSIKTYQTIKNSQISASSVERHLSSLRKFFHFLKMEEIITVNPFEIRENAKEPQDPWKLTEFKNFLYVYNSSRLTIKNYIMDVRQFMQWAEHVSGSTSTYLAAEKNVFTKITPALVNEYKSRLMTETSLSPLSINRKLSSLRKYVSWLESNGHLNGIQNAKFKVQNLPEKTAPNPIKNDQVLSADSPITQSKDIKENQFSKIPPVRVVQKINKATNLVLDSLVITPVAKTIESIAAKADSGPLFVNPHKELLHTATEPIVNIKKEFYAPLSIATGQFPLHKKAWHHIRHTRPVWYKNYHAFPVVHYIHFAVLIIFMSVIGISMHRVLIEDTSTNRSVFAAPTAPPRIMSFQGRLTTADGVPITTPQEVTFNMYGEADASESASLWTEAQSVTPDEQGVFSVYLGSSESIPADVFSQNQEVYLGVAIGTEPELLPRQQLASVAYATNSEFLQGLAPITQTDAGTKNVILALNSSGNLSIGGTASPVFEATGGSFTLSGTTVVLTTPDTDGVIDTQRPLQNTTSNNTVPGSVEVNDIFSIQAASTSAALTIDQTDTGALLTASKSGAVKFQVGNTGNVGIGTGASSDFMLMAAGSIGPSADGSYDLGSSSKRFKNLYLSGTVNADGTQTITNTNPTINFVDSSTDEDDWNINLDGSTLRFRNTTDSADYFTINGSGVANFTQAVNMGDLTVIGTTGITLSGAGADLNFANGEKIDNDTDNVVNVGFGATGGTLLLTNGSTLSTDQTTFNLVNTTATTLHIGGEATAVNIGATTGTTAVRNNLAVTGTSTLTGNTSVSGTLGVTGATTLSSTLGVTGATSLASTLGVTGATTLSSTLGVTGATTLSNTLNVSGASTLAALSATSGSFSTTLGVTGATTLSSTLGVSGATTLSNTLSVSGASTFSSTGSFADTLSLTKASGTGLAVTADATIGGNLAVTGTLSAGATAFDSLTVGGGYGSTGITMSNTGNIQMDGNLTVGGSATFNGLVTNSSNTQLGDNAADTITFTGVVNSNILPETNNTYNLGSSGTRWATGYFNTIDASTITGTIAGGSTTSNSWTINSDNATANAEIGTIAFETGSNPINAVFQWNASGDGTKVSGYDDNNLFNYPISIYSQVSGGNQTFTSGSLFKYGQNATHAITQSGAFIGTDIDFSSNITAPNTAAGNQTGSKVTLKDGGASAMAIGFQTAGTMDYALDLDGTIGTAEIRLSNDETISNTTDGTIALGGNVTTTGNLNVNSGTGTITSGLINGQTISSAANFTGTLAVGTSLSINGGTALTTTNQTGTGTLVMSTSPTLVTPNIGAATGSSLNLGGGAITSGAINSQTISSAANFTGTVAVATSLSINGGTALTTTNQTGTGSLVLSTSPSLTTPSIAGATLTGTLDFTGTLSDSTGNLTLGDDVDVTGTLTVGGGYGSTGTTISSAGNIQANGTLTVDSTSTLVGMTSIGSLGNQGTMRVYSNSASGTGAYGYFQADNTNLGRVTYFGGGGSASTENSFEFASSVFPYTDDTYSLGTPTKRWADLYVGPSTVHIGTSTSDEGTISYNTTTNILNIGTDSTTNADVAFFTDDLYLDKSAGSVGIGTTTPGTSLNVVGGIVRVGSSDLGAKALEIFSNGSGSVLASFQDNNVSNGSAIVNAALGNSLTGSAYYFKGSGSSTGNAYITSQQSGTGNAVIESLVLGSGDAQALYGINGGQTWAVGLDNSDSDSFKISSGGTLGSSDRLTVLTGGNVGIGTTGPGAKLDVSGNIRVGAGSANSVISFRDADSSNYYRTIEDIGTGLQIANTEAGGKVLSLLGNSGGTDYFETANVDIINFNSGQFYLRQSDGNVGIGTTNPGQLLQLQSTGATTYLNINNNRGSSGGTSALQLGLNDGSFITSDASRVEARVVGNPNSALDFKVYGTQGTSQLNTIMTLLGTGNVGIGNTNPTTKFYVQNGASDTLQYGSNPRLYLQTATGMNGLRIDGDTTPLEIRNSGNTTNSVTFGGSNFDLSFFPPDATAGTTTRDSQSIFLTGKSWNGSASVNGMQGKIYAKVTSASSPYGGLSLGTTSGSGGDAVFIENVSGEVGIGTTAPASKLHLVTTDSSSTSNVDVAILNHELSSGASGAGFGTGLLFRGTSGGGALTNYDQARIRTVTNTAGDNNAHGLAFETRTNAGTGLTEKVRIDPSGNVGIGTTSPIAKLDVNGNINLTTYGTITGGTTGNIMTIIKGTGASGNIEIGGGNNGDIILYNHTTERARFDDGGNSYIVGNLGIGTTGPDEKLHVSGSTAGDGAHIGNAFVGVWDANNTFAAFAHDTVKATTGSYALVQNSSGATFLNSASGQSLSLRINNSDALVINSSSNVTTTGDLTVSGGNVGIGTAADPSAALAVVGITSLGSATANLGYSSDYDLQIGSESGNNGVMIRAGTTGISKIGFDDGCCAEGIGRIWYDHTNNDLNLYANSTLGLTVDTTGAVGIGTTGPAAKLDILDNGYSGAYLSRITADDQNPYIEAFTNTAASQTWGTFIFNNDTYVLRDITDGRDVIAFDGSGNVGIGATAPTQKLDVSGGIKMFGGNYSVQKFQEIRSLGGTAGDTTEIGTFAVNGTGSYTKFFVSAHNCDTITQTEFEAYDTHYAGATTGWVELPAVRGNNYDGTQTEAIDVRKQSNASVLEVRLRNKGGACGAGNVMVNIETSSQTFTASSTAGSGGTVAGYFASNLGYKFPVATNRFTTSTNGLFIDNDGTVGIGTTTSSYDLTINATQSTTTAISLQGTSNVGWGINKARVHFDGLISGADNSGVVNNVSLDSASGLDAYGSVINNTIVATTGQTNPNYYAELIMAPTKSGTGTITNAYGLYIQAPTIGSTSNIGLYNAGTTTLAGNVTMSAGYINFGGAGSNRIVPGSGGFAINNSSDSASNLFVAAAVGGGSNYFLGTLSVGTTSSDGFGLRVEDHVRIANTGQNGRIEFRGGSDGGNSSTMYMYNTSNTLVNVLNADASSYINGGNFGIGEVSPGAKLAVSGGATIGASYDTLGAPTNGLIIEGAVGIGFTSPTTAKLEVAASDFNTGLWVHSSGTVGAGVTLNATGAGGHTMHMIATNNGSLIGGSKWGIYDEDQGSYIFAADNAGSAYLRMPTSTGNLGLCWQDLADLEKVVDCASAPTDLAENYGALDSSIEAGDIVVLDGQAEDIADFRGQGHTSKANIKKTTAPYQGALLGVVSTNPNQVYGTDGLFDPSENPQPVSLAGRVPVKVSTENGPIKAGDFLTSSSTPGVAMKATRAGHIIGMALQDFNNDGVGKVVTHIKQTFHDPDVFIASSGDMTITTNSEGKYVATASGNIAEKFGAFAAAAIADLKAGLISAQAVTTKTLVATTQVTSQIFTANTKVVSPLVETELVRTNVITPLSSTSVAIKGNVEVKNESGTTVASITTAGDATFSGQLATNTLTTNEASIAGTLSSQDASISGTLRARNVIADSIEGLEAKIATIAANYIKPNNETPSAPFGYDGSLLDASLSSDYVDIASYSAGLAQIQDLKANFVQIAQGLTVLGPTGMTDVSVAGQLAIGSNFILSNSSINTLGSTLFIQPLKQGAISFMDDALFIDVTGIVKVKGDTEFASNVTVKGTLASNIISPISSDLTIQLPSSEASASALIVKNASGSGVFRVDAGGNVTASGSASLKDIIAQKLTIVRGASADTSFTETVATSSAGTTTIITGETERTIISPFVTTDSLIYITPVSDTQGVTPYIARQTAEDAEENVKGSFTIQIPDRVSQDIKINWWIVN